jgi:hypothetical protein
MKKLVSFRTDAENKAMLISRARELGLPLSEYLDQITTEFHFEEDITPTEDTHQINESLLREQYLRSQVVLMNKLIKESHWKKKSYHDKEKLLVELISIIDETHWKHQVMLIKEGLQ